MEREPESSRMNGTTTRRRLIIVDDERSVRNAIRRLFRMLGYSVDTASTGTEALELIPREPVDVVISDMRMPGMTGVELLEAVSASWPDTVRILLTGYSPAEPVKQAVVGGAVDLVLRKPWSNDALEQCVTDAILKRRVRQRKRD